MIQQETVCTNHCMIKGIVMRNNKIPSKSWISYQFKYILDYYGNIKLAHEQRVEKYNDYSHFTM